MYDLCRRLCAQNSAFVGVTWVHTVLLSSTWQKMEIGIIRTQKIKGKHTYTLMQLQTFITYFNYIHFSYAKIWETCKHKTPVLSISVHGFSVKKSDTIIYIYRPIKLGFITSHIKCCLRHQKITVRKAYIIS
jgi:hypothetical protein